MAEDLYGLGASGIPPELAAEMMGIKGRKAIAQALMEQSMQPLQAPEVKGRFSVPISPFQGMAKLAQSYLGQKGLSESDKAMAGVGQKYQTGVADALSKSEQIRQGTPAVEYQPGVSQGPVQPKPAVQGNPQEAVKFALQNQYLQKHPYTQFLTQRAGKAEDLAEASALRKSERAEQFDRDAALRRELAERNEQLRRDLASQSENLRRDLSQPKPKLKPGERFKDDGTVEPIPGSDLYRGQSDKHAKDFNAVNVTNEASKSAIDKIDWILDPKKENDFKSNFGLSTIVGSKYLTEGARNMKAKVESLKSDLKTEGLKLIRTGGSPGQITEREWPIIEQLIDSLDPLMGEDNAKQVLESIKARMGRMKNIANESYNTEWAESPFYKGKGESDSGWSDL